jgi:hypothetical protein
MGHSLDTHGSRPRAFRFKGAIYSTWRLRVHSGPLDFDLPLASIIFIQVEGLLAARRRLRRQIGTG